LRPGAPVEIPLPDVARAQRTWTVRDPGDPTALAAELGVPPLVAKLLLNRGVDDVDTARLWLDGSLRDLPDPRAMHGMTEAVERVLAALDGRERICVHGDYDVDGCTSVALLVHLLRRLDADVTWYAPHRERDGYGVALHTIDRLAAEGVQLLITCDTGVSAHEAIDAALGHGIETVVCDHHTPPAELPRAAAIINPRLDGEQSPYWELAAVGVSFMLAVALRARLRERGDFAQKREPDLREYLDIVALGTVADLAPLRGINRLLVRTGLKVLATRRRPGLRALMDVSGVKPDEPVIASHLGFRLGPRINAAGRLAEASSAVELLLAEGDGEARRIAELLDSYNRKRQETERRIFAEALAALEGDPQLAERRGLVVWSEDWHPGVVGIVASRLMQHLHKPALVIAVDGDRGVGSGRGISGVNLFGALKRHESLLIRFGGHRAAAGLSVLLKDLPALRDAFADEAFTGEPEELWEPRLKLDAELPLEWASWELSEAVDRLAPFGIGNPQPLFMARGLEASGIRPLSKGGIRMDLRQGQGARMKAIGFRLGVTPDQLSGPLEAVFNLQVNHWRGSSTLELFLKDIRPMAAPS
jgi:single-stranded-DNA-specific exonuclease